MIYKRNTTMQEKYKNIISNKYSLLNSLLRFASLQIVNMNFATPSPAQQMITVLTVN